MLATDDSRVGYSARGGGQNLNAESRHFINGVLETTELRDFGMMLPQPLSDPLERPAESDGRFHGHETMANIGKDVRRRESDELLPAHAIQKLLATGAKDGMRKEMVNEDIRIDEQGRSTWDLIDSHGDSRIPNSSSSASRSALSASPV